MQRPARRYEIRLPLQERRRFPYRRVALREVAERAALPPEQRLGPGLRTPGQEVRRAPLGALRCR
ncbi:hypothetical protein [Streptomyces sp. NPDC048473]|uniref:hypothetical protein n=1 Tax=unclassified Streptomyces TaxID=2593676 RepID=UPI00371BEB07